MEDILLGHCFNTPYPGESLRQNSSSCPEDSVLSRYTFHEASPIGRQGHGAPDECTPDFVHSPRCQHQQWYSGTQGNGSMHILPPSVSTSAFYPYQQYPQTPTTHFTFNNYNSMDPNAHSIMDIPIIFCPTQPEQTYDVYYDPFQSSSWDTAMPSEAQRAAEPANSRARCQWDGCPIELDDITHSGIRRHFRAYHAMHRGAHTQCLWGGTCRSEPMLYENISKHIAECHLKSMARECPTCKNVFARNDTLKRHLNAGCPGLPVSGPTPSY